MNPVKSIGNLARSDSTGWHDLECVTELESDRNRWVTTDELHVFCD